MQYWLMKILRTPDESFENLVEYDFKPNYVNVIDEDGNEVRMHYISEGEGQTTILLLHGQPSWSYLYRKMIKGLQGCGARVLAPDLIGFGRSDKPSEPEDYTYKRHVAWVKSFIDKLEFNHILLFCQDWGGLIGLRLAAFHQNLFSAIIASNTGLPTGDQKMPEEWFAFKRLCKEASKLPIGRLIQSGCVSKLTPEIKKAYAAPYPSSDYVAGARKFPQLIPLERDEPEALINQEAFQLLREFDKPFITAFSDSDPITAKGDLFMRRFIKGAKGRSEHTTIVNGGHFVQEDKPKDLVEVIKKVLAVI